MKKILMGCLCLPFMLGFYACTNDKDDSSMNLSEMIDEAGEISKTSLWGEIIDLPINEAEQKEFRTLFQQTKRMDVRSVNSSDLDGVYDYFADNMLAIKGLPFALKSRSQGSIPSYYLSSKGVGAELGSSLRYNSKEQKFYISVIPSIAGFLYILYSHASGTTVSLGTYSANPKEKVVYVRKGTNGDINNASWEFVPTSDATYFSIQNLSYWAKDPSSSTVYRYCIEARNNNRTGLVKYQKDPRQEFQIIPDAQFKLKKVEFINSLRTKVIKNADYALPIVEVSNTESTTKAMNLSVSKKIAELSNFEEKKSILFKVLVDGFKFSRPSVNLGQIDVTGSNTPKNTDYKTNGPTSYVKDFVKVVPVMVRPRTKLVMTYYLSVYNVETDYVATFEYGGVEVKIGGRWKGVLFVDDIQEPDFEEVNLNSQVRAKRKISVKSVNKENPLFF